MATPIELRQQREKLFRDARALLDKAEGENRDLNADEFEQYEKIRSEADGLQKRIARAEDLEAQERNLNQALRQPVHDDTRGAPPVDSNQSEYREQFDQFIRKQRKTIDVRASTDPQTVGTAADGGYLVPNEHSNRLVESREAVGIMRALANVAESKHGTLTIPKVASHGTAAQTAEGVATTVSKETIGSVTFNAYKIDRIIKVSEELVHDSVFDLVGYVLKELGRSIGRYEEAQFIDGSGSSAPNGIANCTTGVTAASATAVTVDELMELYMSIIAPYRDFGTWIMSDTTLLALMKLKDGNQRPYLQDNLASGAPDKLMGRPIKTSASMPAMTTGLNSIVFGNIEEAYWVVDRKGVSIEVLDQLYKESGLVGYRAYARTDGDIVDTSAVRCITQG